mmetsp:Transcript_58877/g.108744  ORF Transcript_58877/g.108744 Transcript_58877/m.108744 type:complete len:97 (-) Transcript_58877:131-421(-)
MQQWRGMRVLPLCSWEEEEQEQGEEETQKAQATRASHAAAPAATANEGGTAACKCGCMRRLPPVLADIRACGCGAPPWSTAKRLALVMTDPIVGRR